jgi:hypothetical protein
MFDLVKLLRADRSLYVSGGLGDLSTDVFGIWTCIANHPCLQAVGAANEDRMCYAVEQKEDNHTVLHAWGLDSELKLVSENCASNAQQPGARRSSPSNGRTAGAKIGSKGVALDSEKQETASQSSMSGEPTEVEAWLFTIDRGLLQYAPIFKAHAITSLSVLGELTDEDIKADIEPGIKSAGHRVLLRRALSDLRARQAAPSPTSGLDQA